MGKSQNLSENFGEEKKEISYPDENWNKSRRASNQ